MIWTEELLKQFQKDTDAPENAFPVRSDKLKVGDTIHGCWRPGKAETERDQAIFLEPTHGHRSWELLA